MLPFQQKTLMLEIVLDYVTFPTKNIDVRNCTRFVTFPTKTLILEIVLDYVTFPTKNIDVRKCSRLCYLSNKKH